MKKRIILLALLTAANSWAEGRRTNRKFGIAAGLGEPLASLVAGEIDYMPTENIKLGARAGTFFFMRSYGGSADWLFNPSQPVAFTLGLGVDQLHVDDVIGSVFVTAFSGEDTRHESEVTAGMLRVGGDWMTDSGFNMSFGGILATRLRGAETYSSANRKEKRKMKTGGAIPWFYFSVGKYW